jgi:hypothetical protein
VPYTEHGLPFAPRSHTSYRAAVDAAKTRGIKTAAYLHLLRERGPMSDSAAAEFFGWPLSSICSIRNGCGDQIVPMGHSVSKFGKPCTRWGVV